MKRTFGMVAVALLMVGCHGGNGGQEAEGAALDFAGAYFNYDLKRAARHVTPESERWLQFLASNMTEADVEALREKDDASVELKGTEHLDDTTRRVRIHVADYLEMDSIGGTGHVSKEGDYALKVVKRGGRWYVRMEGLPRSERQSRD